jgi:hypothetical protein
MKIAFLLSAISMILFAASCSHTPVMVNPPPPPVCGVQPSPITITPAQVGQPYSVTLENAPASYAVCGTPPSGLKVVSTGGKLMLTGTPKVAGTFNFWLVTN